MPQIVDAQIGDLGLAQDLGPGRPDRRQPEPAERAERLDRLDLAQDRERLLIQRQPVRLAAAS